MRKRLVRSCVDVSSMKQGMTAKKGCSTVSSRRRKKLALFALRPDQSMEFPAAILWRYEPAPGGPCPLAILRAAHKQPKARETLRIYHAQVKYGTQITVTKDEVLRAINYLDATQFPDGRLLSQVADVAKDPEIRKAAREAL